MLRAPSLESAMQKGYEGMKIVHLGVRCEGEEGGVSVVVASYPVLEGFDISRVKVRPT